MEVDRRPDIPAPRIHTQPRRPPWSAPTHMHARITRPDVVATPPSVLFFTSRQSRPEVVDSRPTLATLLSALISAFAQALIRRSNSVFVALFVVSILFSTGQCGALKPTCRVVGHEELIDVAGCDLVVVKVNKCYGFCRSFSFFDPMTNLRQKHSKCCRMTEVQHVTVDVSCRDGAKTVKIPSAVECSCFDC